jgi:hypothetical protein
MGGTVQGEANRWREGGKAGPRMGRETYREGACMLLGSNNVSSRCEQGDRLMQSPERGVCKH